MSEPTKDVWDEKAEELVEHCRYCGMPDYRQKCIDDHRDSVKAVAAALREVNKATNHWFSEANKEHNENIRQAERIKDLEELHLAANHGWQQALDDKEAAQAQAKADAQRELVEPLEKRIKALEELLRRVRQWDHLDIAGDGAYWRREIDAALEGE